MTLRLMGRVVITRFTQAVIKSRPLKRVGAEQVSSISYRPDLGIGTDDRSYWMSKLSRRVC
jgi:hypothetical protein